MQFTILLLLACQVLGQDERDSDGVLDDVAGGQEPSPPVVSILTQHQELEDDGTFKYSFSADNGLQQKEAFHPDGSRTGAYSYVDPRGETVLVHYRADRFGFHVLDGSSIPTTPPLAGRLQGHEDGVEGARDVGGQSYEVEEPDGEGSISADELPSSSPSAAPRLFGFEMTRAPNMAGHHNRFYRSAARELFSEAIVPDQGDLDSVAAEDLSQAPSSYYPYGHSKYVPIQQKSSGFKSPYASLARQILYPVKKGRAEAEVEDGGREQVAATDNGDYSLHAGRYDDGSYAQHAVKYDDGSYAKYARAHGDGQYSEPYGDEGDGRAEYEAEVVRQPAEAHASHY